MKTIRVLQPGQPGTKKLFKKYGNNLICVRYRYDRERKRKLKTIELIIEDTPWQSNNKNIPMNKIMNVRIAVNEVQLRNRVKGKGAKWNPGIKAWQLPYKYVLELGLNERIIK